MPGLMVHQNTIETKHIIITIIIIIRQTRPVSLLSVTRAVLNYHLLSSVSVAPGASQATKIYV